MAIECARIAISLVTPAGLGATSFDADPRRSPASLSANSSSGVVGSEPSNAKRAKTSLTAAPSNDTSLGRIEEQIANFRADGNVVTSRHRGVIISSSRSAA